MVTTQVRERKESAKLESEIATLTASLDAADVEDERRQAQIADLEHQREQLHVEEALGADVQKQIRKLSSRIQVLSAAPDRKHLFRRAITQRQVELQRVRRKEAAAEAARRATELLPKISEIEDRILEAGGDLQVLFDELNKLYALASKAKLIGPRMTPRNVVFESLKRGFLPLIRPFVEGTETSAERPLSSYVELIKVKGSRRS